MPPKALLLVPLLLASTLGAAQARIVINDEPRDLEILHPLDGESLATLLHGRVVRYWWANGSHEPLAPLAPFTRHAVSPDGAWIVRRHLEQDPVTGEFNDTVRAVRVADGNETILRSGELRGLASGGGYVALTTARNQSAWAWRWGEWDQPVELWANLSAEAESRPLIDHGGEAPGTPFDASRAYQLALSGDGGWLAVAIERGVHVFDLATGRLVTPWPATVQDPIVGLALAPHGTHLAILTSQPGRFSEVHTFHRTEDALARQAVRRHVEAGLGLAWGRPGLALVQATHEGLYGAQESLTVRVYPGGASLKDERVWTGAPGHATGALAWLGDRLVVEAGGALSFFSQDAELVMTSRPGEPATFPAPDAPWGPDEIPLTPAQEAGATTPVPPPTERGVPLPWWLPLGALLAVAAALRARRAGGR